MGIRFGLKHYIFNAFREFFVHHHGSLEFRAKIFALLIAADENANIQSFINCKKLCLDIYEGDEERANLLLLSTKELVRKVHDDNGLDIDSLIASIQKELKIVPRYAKKIDTDAMHSLLTLTIDRDTLSYQENILEFLNALKIETLQTKQQEIDAAEKLKKTKGL